RHHRAAVRRRGRGARPRRRRARHGGRRPPPLGWPALAAPGRAPRAADGDRSPQRVRLRPGPSRRRPHARQRRSREGDPRPRRRPAQARPETPRGPRADPATPLTAEESAAVTRRPLGLPPGGGARLARARYADLAVLSDDVFACPESRLKDIVPVLYMVGGTEQPGDTTDDQRRECRSAAV